mmetsp:Transcript_154235/g.287532  ORF Transcript_154235/g.287532 Transcript_154235/m.287532 type:complete len:273 (-) Transcript_154235:30-848(-)
MREHLFAEEGTLDEKTKLLDGNVDGSDEFDEDCVQWYLSGRKYSKRELLADRIVLLLGSAFSLIGCPLIIAHALNSRAEELRLLGIFVYCVGLVFMLNASLVFHWNANNQAWASFLLFIDQFGIYLMICGTYTPVCIQSGAYFLLAAVWALLVLGITLKVVLYGNEHPWKSTLDMTGFFLMGWSVVPFIPQVVPYLSTWAAWCILIQGILYSIGASCLTYRRLEFHYFLWHTFVLAAAVLFYAVAYREFAVNSTVPPLPLAMEAAGHHPKLH